VILIVVDALRPGHTEPYGYHRPTTPHLSKRVAQAGMVRINHVYGSCSESTCGLASLASSRYLHNYPPNPLSLPEVLQLHGYAIHMILGGDHTNHYNLRNVYGKVNNYFDGSMAKGFYMNDDSFVLNKTRALPRWGGNPIMLQYHLMSNHVLGKRLPAYTLFKPAASYAGKTRGGPDVRYTNFYDNGVLQTDAIIHAILTDLEAKHYLDHSIVVITADHGESLGEKGVRAHGNSINEEALRIPLFISGMGELAVAPGQPVGQVDIAPSILHELKLPIPPNWDGLPLQSGARRRPGDGFLHFSMREHIGLLDTRTPGPLKYRRNAQDNMEAVYDLVSDPSEQHNVIESLAQPRRLEWRRHAREVLDQ